MKNQSKEKKKKLKKISNASRKQNQKRGLHGKRS